MKVAYLVDYNIRTRVVVDVPENMDEDSEGFTDLIDAACTSKFADEGNTLVWRFAAENITEVEEDTECPYGSINGDDT